MALMMALEPWPADGRWGPPLEQEPQLLIQGPKGVICMEGIYDFGACRDAHAQGAYADIYEAFTSAAFGPETADGGGGGGGGWERGNVVRYVREGGKVRSGVRRVLLVQSPEDEMVEWGQVEAMKRALGADERVCLVEVAGGHEQIEEEGLVLGRCLDMIVGASSG